jgi:predicted nucleic acid-binding protein
VIFVDSNVILRYLTFSPEPHLQAQQRQAAALFAAVQRGEQTSTTSEVVLHEVAYVLTSKRTYGVPREDVADYLRTIVDLTGMRFPTGEKTLFLRAIELFGNHPAIKMADALVMARAERLHIPLATFDRDLDRLPYAESWTFLD